MRRQILPRLLRPGLCFLLALILHEFLAEGVGLGDRPSPAGFLPLLLGYLAGCCFPGKRRGWLLLPPACVGAVYLQALAAGASPSLSLHTGLYALDAVLLFILGRSRKQAWPSALGLPAAGLGLLTCAILSWRGQSAAFPGLCALAACLIRLLDMHREGLEAGLHNAPGEEPMPYPRGLRHKNRLLVALFLVLALGAAAIPGPPKGADRLWETAVSGTKEWTAGIAAKLKEKAEEPPAATPSPTPSPTPAPTPAPTPEPEPEPTEAAPREGVPPALRFGRVLVPLLLLAALALLWRRGGKTGFSLRKLWARLKRLFREREPETAYVDEVEKLRPRKATAEPAKEGVIARIRRARRKPLRLADLPDDRTRIRFVYRELLRSSPGVKLTPAMTPSEVGAAVKSAPIRALVEEYNLARYSPRSAVSGESGHIAASALQWVRSEERRQAASLAEERRRDRADTRRRRPAAGPSGAPGKAPSGPADAAAGPAAAAVFPAAPVWLPLADVMENIRCAAPDKAAALQAAELAGLPEALLRERPKALTREQQWRVMIARALAAQTGLREADLTALTDADAAFVSEVLTGIADREGMPLTLRTADGGAAPKRTTAPEAGCETASRREIQDVEGGPTMAKLRYTARFKRDYRRGVEKGCRPEKLKALLELLRLDAPLPLDAKDGPVKGMSARACRVEPGWILYYRVREGTVTLLRVKYVPGERPTGAPPAGLWFRTLLRSPVKTLVTVLLLAVAAFLFLYNLSGHLLQREASRQAEAGFQGVLTVEKSPVERLDDLGHYDWFLLSDPSNPGRKFVSYEEVHHEGLTGEELEELAALPGVDEVDCRYMTAGISEDYRRLDSFRACFNNGDRCILEATVLSEPQPVPESLKRFSLGYSSVNEFTLGDPKLLAGDPAWLETQLACYDGKVKMVAAALKDEIIGTEKAHHIVNGRYRHTVSCDDYDLSQAAVDGIRPGRRYVFVLRADPFEREKPFFEIGDDTRKDWWPYITDVTDLPENYLEGEEFAPLRELIQVTEDDLHTFDVVYTSDMASIRRVARELVLPGQGRFLTPEDAGKPLCVVSETFLQTYGLRPGDSITLNLGNVLCEQYVPLGAVAATRGRHATETEAQTFTIVGSFRDVFDQKWLDQDLYWSYGENTVFMPAEFLPAACNTEGHVFRPAEVSFVVGDAWSIVPFEENCIPQVEAMGYRYSFLDGNWPSVAEKLSQARSLTLVKLLIFSAAALLAAGLTLWLFLHRRRREYAVLRALGCPRRGAAAALWRPLMALAAFAAALGAAGAYLRSGALAARSLAEFEAAGIGVVAPVRAVWFLWGALGLLCLLGLVSALYLRSLGRRSPLQLLQDGARAREVKEAAEAAAAAASITAPAPAPAPAGTAPLPAAPARGRPAPGFLPRYVFRHIRRAGAKTLLALLTAALLAGAVGQLTMLKARSGEAAAAAPVSVHYYDGLPYAKAQKIESSGYVSDPVYFKAFTDAELEFEKTQVWFLNRLEGFIFDPVTWLEGWDGETAMKESSRICILTAPDMERLGVELGDRVRINEGGCIEKLMESFHVSPRTREEQVALRDAHRQFYTVIGRVETENRASIIYVPVTAYTWYGCFGYTLRLDEASYRLNSYFEKDEFRRWSDRLLANTAGPSKFQMDTSDADRIYRICRMIETLYPLTVAAALLLGGLLPVLMILQEQKEAAILRALGWSKRLTRRRFTLEQAVLCLAGLVLACAVLLGINGAAILQAGSVPFFYLPAHLALCAAASAAVAAAILHRSPMTLLQAKE